MPTTHNSLITTQKRLLILVLSIIFLFCSLILRLFFVQIIDGVSLQAKATDQWYRDLPLEAPRGKILDSNGSVLADNINVYTVYARPRAITNLDLVSKVLCDNLKSLDLEKLKVKLKTKVSELTIMRGVDAVTASLIRDYRLDGIYLTPDSRRNYPNSSSLAQVLGFTNIDNIGQNGLEGYYDKYLAGTDGIAYTSTDLQGIELPNSTTKYLPPISGMDINLTIDANIQAFCDTAVVSATKEWGSKSSSILVMDAKSGGIVGMSIAPSFDLNDLPRDDIHKLNALSKNKMIVDVYEPGSTFKIFTTASAIEQGVTSSSDRYYCNGGRVVDGKRIKCWRSIGHGSQTLEQGVNNSCNCVFMDLALKMGVKNFYEGIRKFGFGSKTGVDFFGESRGLLMNEKSVKTVDLARIGFGQAVAVTPLQLVAGVSSVVNGGTYFSPHFAKNISVDGSNMVVNNTVASRQVLSKTTSDKMIAMLEDVVANGSGKKAQVPGFRVGGKTGTAQKYENGVIAQGKYVSSFVGFAPCEDPQYVVLMIVDEPSSYVYYGSITAAPYAGNVLEQIFQYKGIAPTVSTDVKHVVMPNLIGMQIESAAKLLKSMNIQYELVGEDSMVLSTIPSSGTKIPEKDIILIRCEKNV